jgi:hypothetical protein
MNTTQTTTLTRQQTIQRIRKALRARSGKAWSVTGGRGTAWGWIRIDAPPARCTAQHQLKDGAADYPENYEDVDTGVPGGHMTPADRAELARLLGKEDIHFQGESIPASNDDYQEYVDRAEGRTPAKIAEPYWD